MCKNHCCTWQILMFRSEWFCGRPTKNRPEWEKEVKLNGPRVFKQHAKPLDEIHQCYKKPVYFVTERENSTLWLHFLFGFILYNTKVNLPVPGQLWCYFPGNSFSKCEINIKMSLCEKLVCSSCMRKSPTEAISPRTAICEPTAASMCGTLLEVS